MATFVRLSRSTLHLLESTAYRLNHLNPRQEVINPYPYYLYDVIDGLVEIDALRAYLIYLDNAAKQYRDNNELTTNYVGIEEEGLVCEIDLEIIPLYKEAISVSALRYIIEPEKIQFLLRFIGIPKSKKVLDIENHQFGYHFHYGKVKSGKLKRTDLLFTFDPKTQQDDDAQPPLYYEYHGEGHSKHIDAGTIGNNKRKPIYLVCYDEALKRGIINFKRLKKDPCVFYP